MTNLPFLRKLIAIWLVLIFTTAACGGSVILTAPPSEVPTVPPVGPGNDATPAVDAPTGIPAPILPTQPLIINEARRLTLEFPPRMRAGVESDVVRLTLEADDSGNITPTARYQGNVVTGGTIHVPDLYETHNVTAEAQLDLAGMVVQPAGAIYEPLKRGQSAVFQWSVRPQETGKYRGTVWLHLGFEKRSTGEKDRVAISAQIIEIEAVDFFGFSVNFVRTSGVIGSVVGVIVGFPFLDDIVKYLFKRRKKKK